MKRAARVDDNQGLIVDALRKAGATVEILSAIGKGCPDICVGFKGATFLLEIKDGSKKPSARYLTADQLNWHARWKGHVVVVNNVREALTAIGINVAGADFA